MHILLVEDDENKRAQLISFIRLTWPESGLDVATSLQSGLRALPTEKFTFVILDMTLPNYEVGPGENGGIIHQKGGSEFLRKMKRLGIKIPTAVVTQFETFGWGRERIDLDSLRESLENDYGDVCVGTIYYNSTIDSWKDQLREVVNAAHSDTP
jgi:DNA-binding NarL/FixJ family response regulator